MQVNNVSQFNSTLSDTLDTFNITDLKIQLAKADDSMDSINFNDTLDMVRDLKDSIALFSIDTSFTDALRLVQAYFDLVEPLLRRAVASTTGGLNGDTEGDYLLLAKGFCTSDSTTICVTNSDCVSADCGNLGKYRCANDGATACTADADCSGSYCLADSSLITNLAAVLSGYGTSEVDGAALSSALGDLNNFDGISDQVQAAQDAVAAGRDAATAFNVSDASAMIGDFNDAIETLGLDDIIQQIRDAQEQMADLKVAEKIDPYKDYGKHQRRLSRKMEDILVDITTVRAFFFDPTVGLAVAFRNLAPTVLQDIYTANGPSFVVKYILAEVDALNNYFADNIITQNISRSDRASSMNGTLDTLDKMGGYEQAGYGDMRENGATYYLMRLSGADTVLASFATFAGVWVDSNGEEYPDDLTCTMETCEDHTWDVINNDMISEWPLEMPFFPELALDYTLGQIFLAMWIPPLITAFLGLNVFLLNFKFYKERARKCCTFMFMSCVFCQLPFILLFTAMIFPMSVVISDVCDSGGNIGTSYLVAYGDDMCANSFGGVGSLSACDVVVDTVGSENITITVDILGMYESVVNGKCSGEDPFASIMDTLAEEIVDQPSEALDDWFEDNEDMKLREPLKNVMREAAINEGNSLAFFFSFAGSNLFNCEHFADLFQQFSGATCGSFMTPFLWLVGSWYLAAWIIVCCAFPAGCLKKRYNLKDEDDGVEAEDLLAPEGHGEVEMTDHPAQEEEEEEDENFGIDEGDDVNRKVAKNDEEHLEIEVRESNWV
jgi:hypothetical protein